MFKRKGKNTPRRKRRGKSNHVLAVILKTLKKRQKSDCPAVFGYSRWTVKRIILGKLNFSHRAAKKISERTNVAIEWLLAGNGNVPPVTRDAKPFTLDSYIQYRMKKESDSLNALMQRPPPSASGLFVFIIIRAARLMDAAAAAGKSIEASWKLKEAINSLGSDFPDYAKRGHDFEMSLVSGMIQKWPKGRGFDYLKAIFERLQQTEKSRR
jgi:thymidylate synthase